MASDPNFTPDEMGTLPNDPNFTPDPAPPSSLSGTLKAGLMNTLGAAGKAVDTLSGAGSIVRPTIANALGVARPGDTPDLLSMKRYPDMGEIMKRAGIKDVSPSTFLPGYAKPGQGKWYQPEQNGALDPHLSSFAQVATDPTSYLGLGELGAEKNLAMNSPVTQATRGAPNLLQKAGNALTMPTQGAANAVRALPGGQTVLDASTAASTLLGKLGGMAYRSGFEPVEYQGAKYGKADAAGTMFQAGVKSPLGVRGKGDALTSSLIGARDALNAKAGAAGAVTSMQDAMAPVQAEIAAIRRSGDPHLQPVADAVEAKVNEYLQLEKGTPAVPPIPPTTKEVPHFMDSTGDMVTKTEPVPGVPGTPAVAGRQVTPAQASGYKSSLYNSMPGTAFDSAMKTDAGVRLQKAMSAGLKTAGRDSVGQTLGPATQQAVTDLDEAAGKFLATRRSQTLVGHQAQRQADRIVSPTGTDGVLAGIGAASGGQTGAIAAVGVKKLSDLLRAGYPTAGYGLKSAAQNPFVGQFTNEQAKAFLRSMADKQAKGGNQ